LGRLIVLALKPARQCAGFAAIMRKEQSQMSKILYVLMMLHNGDAYIVDYDLTVEDCATAQAQAYAIAETAKSGDEFLCLDNE